MVACTSSETIRDPSAMAGVVALILWDKPLHRPRKPLPSTTFPMAQVATPTSSATLASNVTIDRSLESLSPSSDPAHTRRWWMLANYRTGAHSSLTQPCIIIGHPSLHSEKILVLPKINVRALTDFLQAQNELHLWGGCWWRRVLGLI